MELRKPIETKGTLVIEYEEQIQFKPLQIEEWKKLFQEFRDAGQIVGVFDGIEWGLYSSHLDIYLKVTFDLDIFKGANNLFKALVLTMKTKGYSPQYVVRTVNVLKKCVQYSKNFSDITGLENYISSVSSKSSSSSNVTIESLRKLMDFYTLSHAQEIEGICNKYHTKLVWENRDLPKFNDVLVFGEIVNDYFRKYPPEQTLQYSPVLLWWLITNIIPMRPAQFFLLEKNCLEWGIDESDNDTYWINIRRVKQKFSSNTDIKSYYKVQIDKTTYDIMNEYKGLIDKIDADSPWFFPITLYRAHRNRTAVRKSAKVKTRMTTTDFDTVLDDFYSDVVKGLYKEELERITPGDTRHFAIINMFLQGFNMLSIKQLAGHENIVTQDGYYSHAEHFVQSYVYRLAQKHLHGRISNNFSDGFVGWRRFIFDKSAIYKCNVTRDDIVGRIEYGDCIELKSNFPDSCIEDCRLCPKFIFNPPQGDYDEGLRWLEDSSKILNAKIKETILMMKDLCESLNIHSSPANDNLLKTHSRQLVSYMDMKALVDSKITQGGVSLYE